MIGGKKEFFPHERSWVIWSCILDFHPARRRWRRMLLKLHARLGRVKRMDGKDERFTTWGDSLHFKTPHISKVNYTADVMIYNVDIHYVMYILYKYNYNTLSHKNSRESPESRAIYSYSWKGAEPSFVSRRVGSQTSFTLDPWFRFRTATVPLKKSCRKRLFLCNSCIFGLFFCWMAGGHILL